MNEDLKTVLTDLLTIMECHDRCISMLCRMDIDGPENGDRIMVLRSLETARDGAKLTLARIEAL